MMRLTQENQYHHLPTIKDGKQSLEDISQMFGGSVRRKGIFNPEHAFRSTDDGVTALHGRTGKDDRTIVIFRGLSGPVQLARWAAVEAYKARGGQSRTDLEIEVPGLTASKEWNGRYRQAHDAISGRKSALDDERWEASRALIDSSAAMSNIAYNREIAKLHRGYDERQQEFEDERKAIDAGLATFLVSPDEAFGESGLERYCDGFTNAIAAAVQPLPGSTIEEHIALNQQTHDELMAQPLPDFDNRNLRVSRFLLRQGNGLQDLAHKLTRHYGEMLFHSDTDPGATVARTLGARSLDHFDYTWETAMKAKTPLASGQMVMRSFLS